MRNIVGSAIVALLALLVAPQTAFAGPDGTGRLSVTVLSGRPDTVTGGDALVRVSAPPHLPLGRIRVAVGARDVTSLFRPDPDVHGITALVGGLRLSVIRATAPGAGSDSLAVLDHPLTGPVFSGPHEHPFICETEQFTLPVIGGTLGEPLDDDCSVATRVDHFYRSTSGAFRPWPDTGRYPDDLATTTTSLGVTVPFVVRMETGTANRGIYQTAVLHDPLAEPEPSPFARPAGWNRRLIYTLGGGCTGGWYRQGNTTGGVTDAFMLGQGFAVASSSLNVFGNNCDDLTSAETAMTVKERFVERYGTVAHTIGFGCSGGSYQAHQIVDDYPGIFDGIIPGCSFPEVGFGTVSMITDAWLLDNYLATATGWSAEQKRAVTGFATYATAPNVAVGARRIDPRAFCGVLPEELRYDPETNPDGARCDVFSHAVNVYGTDPATGLPRRPLDNVGVQYGLAALRDGVVTPDQFLDLNERVGGFDADANIVPGRIEADLAAVRTAYRTGRLTNGGGGLKDVPIIDYRAYVDDQPGGDIHVRYHSLSMQARLEKANGTSANRVSLLEDARYGLYSTDSPLLRHAIVQMDRWLTALSRDTSTAPRIDRIVHAKPAELREGCMTRTANPAFVAEPLDRDPASTCEALYPSASFPREVAGADIAADVVKCVLTQPVRGDYPAFTDAQWDRLGAVFPTGVCDYDRPGVAQQGLAGTWLRF
ncbi:DUF6351 family protein [Actinophytocola oryzae]|uniref:DUF6351 domain-containing protein n=1 Tax=Actinophytocola oryzae TaxID=502181 RepID=A0A4R7W465_9PSEU|nr:DUF6351 family protein [Actinophytocola oryzae]TDV57476.1 hypothetical protein CLV71_101347 [Actinophytocola oryzae]